MVILFKPNKSLAVTSKSVILQREDLADKLLFYFPVTYDDIIFTDVSVRLYYKDPGNNVHSEELVSVDSDKEGYIKYLLPITNKLTENAGEVELWLEIVNVSSDSGISGTTVNTIHSTSTTIAIEKWDSYMESTAISKLEEKVDALALKVEALLEKDNPEISA